MKKRNIIWIMAILIALIGFLEILRTSRLFFDPSPPLEHLTWQKLNTFKVLLEGMPSTYDKFQMLQEGRIYDSTEVVASIISLKPAMHILSGSGDNRFLDPFSERWRFRVDGSTLQVWSVGLNKINQGGDGDDLLITIKKK